MIPCCSSLGLDNYLNCFFEAILVLQDFIKIVQLYPMIKTGIILRVCKVFTIHGNVHFMDQIHTFLSCFHEKFSVVGKNTAINNYFPMNVIILHVHKKFCMDIFVSIIDMLHKKFMDGL